MTEMLNAHTWFNLQKRCEQHGIAYVIVSVASVSGSSPRNVGAKMVVTRDIFAGTIGGGHLEYKALQQARDGLAGHAEKHVTEVCDFVLGASLGQCCGGRVSLIFEYRAMQKLPVVVFGAGHVSRALVPLLAQLPVQIIWVDGRYAMLPDTVPDGVVAHFEEHPVDVIDDCAAGTCYLIMTHHHGLDLQLAEAALKRGDTAYVGVIGSRTKGAKFRLQLQAKLKSCDLSVFHCPLGSEHIHGKQPIEIAVSTAAKVIQLYQARLHGHSGAHSSEQAPTEVAHVLGLEV